MGDKFTEGIFMGLIDDAERLITGDALGEIITPVSYSLREKEPSVPAREESPLEAVYREACHSGKRASFPGRPVRLARPAFRGQQTICLALPRQDRERTKEEPACWTSSRSIRSGRCCTKAAASGQWHG